MKWSRAGPWSLQSLWSLVRDTLTITRFGKTSWCSGIRFRITRSECFRNSWISVFIKPYATGSNIWEHHTMSSVERTLKLITFFLPLYLINSHQHLLLLKFHSALSEFCSYFSIFNRFSARLKKNSGPIIVRYKNYKLVKVFVYAHF